MSDLLTLTLVSIGLIIYLYSCKNDFKNWQNFDAREKSYTLRLPMLLIVVIIILIIKIIQDS
jgi:hypothetical protein